MVELWNSEQWNNDDGTVSWNSAKVIKEQCGETVEQ